MNAVKLPRILLVDDHPDTVEFTALILSKRGYSVVRAFSVADARAAASKIQCDLLITDCGLPDGNGIELLRELKAQYGMAGILLSGSVEDGQIVEADGFKFFAKPVNLNSLLDTLENLNSQ